MSRGVHRSIVVLAAAAACFFVSSVALAAAQQYPPPTPTATPTASPTATKTPKPHKCAVTGVITKNGRFRAQREFEAGQRIAVAGKAKCTKKNGRVRVSLDINGDLRRIGTGKANDRGAYTIKGRVPEDASLGSHDLFVTTGNRTYETTIEVVVDSSANSGFSATAGPFLAAWVALAGVVAAFFVGSRRRRRPVLAVAEAPELEVPMLDTSGFIPSLPKRRRAARGKKKPAKRKSAAKKKAPARKAPLQGSKKAKPKPAARKPKGAASKATKRKPTKGRATTKRSGPKAPKRTTNSAKATPAKRKKNGPGR